VLEDQLVLVLPPNINGRAAEMILLVIATQSAFQFQAVMVWVYINAGLRPKPKHQRAKKTRREKTLAAYHDAGT
jgi:hypothetical protein